MLTVPDCTDSEPIRGAEGAFTRLEDTSRNPRVDPTRSHFIVRFYPECGEASVGWVPDGPEWRTVDEFSDEDDVEPDDEEDRGAANWDRANRRARSESRRYMVRNGLRYMWVLTVEGKGLHGPDGRAEVMLRVASFVRRLRTVLGEDFAYWASPELHPGGHGWHVNFFVGSRIEHETMQPLWGHGIVWVTDWLRPKRGSTAMAWRRLSKRERLRRAATYGCKYAEKDWDAENVGRGRRRYTIAEGFSPRVVVRAVLTRSLGFGLAVELADGEAPSVHIMSDECAGYAGPPWDWLSWS